MQPVLELKNVSFRYEQSVVLANVDLAVLPGDFLGLVGPNGSGKTTLLKIILGLLQPDEGTVTLFGQPISRFRHWSRIGCVAQNAAAASGGFPATVREVVATGRVAQRGLLRPLQRDDWRMVDEVLQLVGMADLKDRLIGRLSGGQQQRVFIARALASRPELLILDEPTVGVDADAEEQFYALIAKLRREVGLTVIMVSHDIGVITAQVNKLACLNKRLYFHGPPEQFGAEQLEDLYGHRVTLVAHSH